MMVTMLEQTEKCWGNMESLRNHGLGVLDENIETNERSSALVASKTRMVRTCVNSSRRYWPLNDWKALLLECVGVPTCLRVD
jgi:hypothetical protein